MSKDVQTKPYWYIAKYKLNGYNATREGSIHAEYAYRAMEELEKKFDSMDSDPDITIYYIKDGGEVGDRIMSNNGKSKTTKTVPKVDPWKFGHEKNFPTFAVLKLEDK